VGNIHVEPILDILHGSSRKRYEISLSLDVNTDSISGLEGAIGHSIYGICKEVVFSSEICKLVAYYA
jgi:hypothetical protein